MRKIEVKPSYYAWDVYLNDDFYYSFDGVFLADDILAYGFANDENPDDVSDVTYEGLRDVADMYVFSMQDEILDRTENHSDEEDDDTCFNLTEEEIDELSRQLVNTWAQHFDVCKA